MKLLKILLLILTISLYSCGSLKDNFDHSSSRKEAGIVRIPQFQKGEGTLTWAHYDATKRGSMIYVDKSGNVRILAENPPDAAIQSITEISAKVGEIKGVGSVDAALKTQRSIAELGKRTAAVNMMRDALYRLNEMYYSSVDRTNNILKKREEYLTNIKLEQPKKNDEVISYVDKLYPINKELEIDANNDFLKSLFEKVLDNTKEIAVEEAKAEIEITKYTSQKEQEIAKTRMSQIESLMKVFESVKDSLDKDEKKKYLDELLKLKK